MRKTIPDAIAFSRPFVVESDEGANSVIFEADGRMHRIGPDEARRVAKALLQAASVVEQATRVADGGGSAPDDDLPDLY